MKFFIDNNLPPPLAHALRELSKPEDHVVSHLKDQFSANTPDIEWIKRLSEEGGWIVVTHDNLNKGLEREALRKAGLLVFFLDKSWTNHKFGRRLTTSLNGGRASLSKLLVSKVALRFRLNGILVARGNLSR